MPRLRTMATLVQRCQRRADKENDPQIDSSVGGEWYALIDEAFGEFYMLVAESGMRQFETALQYQPGGNTIPQPTDLMAMVGVYWITDTVNGYRIALRPLMVEERTRWLGRKGGNTERYDLIDQTVTLYPDPTGLARTFELVYIPQPPDLTTYTAQEQVDLITADGEAFVIWSAAIKALSKSESDVSLAIQERERLRTQVLEWATLRRFNDPIRRMVIDTPNGDDYPYGGWDDGDFGINPPK